MVYCLQALVESLRLHSDFMGNVSEVLCDVGNQERIYRENKSWGLRVALKHYIVGYLPMNVE